MRSHAHYLPVDMGRGASVRCLDWAKWEEQGRVLGNQSGRGGCRLGEVVWRRRGGEKDRGPGGGGGWSTRNGDWTVSRSPGGEGVCGGREGWREGRGVYRGGDGGIRGGDGVYKGRGGEGPLNEITRVTKCGAPGGSFTNITRRRDNNGALATPQVLAQGLCTILASGQSFC